MKNNSSKKKSVNNNNNLKKRIIFWWPKKGESIKPQVSMTSITISGILFTCILLSLCSGFIDLVFFSGLSKSKFTIFGNIPIAAGVLYTAISIGLISAKFWCAAWLGAIKELQNRFKLAGYDWYKNLNKLKFKWNFAHKFLIAISIITSLSLSVNSIGSGIRTVEQTIKNMSADANELIELNKSISESEKDRRSANKEGISNKQTAKETAKTEVDTYWSYVEDYRNKRDKIEADDSLSEYQKTSQINQLRKSAVNKVPKLTSKNIDYLSRTELEALLRTDAESNENIDTASLYEEYLVYDRQQVEDKIKALADKEYKNPDGTIVQFLDSDGNPINAQLAISRLQNSINMWQAPNTGDVGESSKIFTLISTYLRADVSAGGMGASEWMLLIFIAIAGIAQEFLIALFTPKATIDRKMLSKFDDYFGKFDVNRFLIGIYMDYLEKGVISQEDFEAKARKCVAIIEKNSSIDDVIARFSSVNEEKPKIEETVIKTVKRHKPTPIENEEKPTNNITSSENTFSSEVDDLVKEIEEMI